MGKAGHDRIGVLFCQIQQYMLQGVDEASDIVDGCAQIESDVCRYLVIARTGGMQPFACITYQFCQSPFDIKVNILLFEPPVEFTISDFLADLFQAFFDGFEISNLDDPCSSEHTCVGK